MKKGLVLFITLAAIAVSPKAAQAARPEMGSEACQGALSTDKLVRVEIVKGEPELRDCPRGARSPYLCSLHRAGLAHRSLGHAMRTTLADLGDGTCGRINLRGVLIHKADGRTMEGDKFVDPSRKLPVSDLRFGAWKTAVLYLAPVSGEDQIAACTQELGDCQAKLDKAVQCVDKPVAAPTAEAVHPAPAKCVECPKCEVKKCPTCTAKVDDMRDCVAERDALRKEAADLKPKAAIGDKAQACGAKGQLFNANTHQCVPSAGLSPEIARVAAGRIGALEAHVESLRSILRKVKGCSGKYRFTSNTDGWCDTSRR